jgi:uncharacterized membrane protein YjjB (DUF3815 family)
MKLLGFYFSFISVLIITYTLFLRYFHLDPNLLILGGIIGFTDLAAAYLLMIEKRMGILLGTFVSAITVGFSAYFLGDHYFSSTAIPALPDIIMIAVSLLAFLLCLSISPLSRVQSEEQI